jgi:hypothetical protein
MTPRTPAQGMALSLIIALMLVAAVAVATYGFIWVTGI